MISSICGASNGYVSTIFVRIARWTEDLTLDFAPADILSYVSFNPHSRLYTYSFLNILLHAVGKLLNHPVQQHKWP